MGAATDPSGPVKGRSAPRQSTVMRSWTAAVTASARGSSSTASSVPTEPSRVAPASW